MGRIVPIEGKVIPITEVNDPVFSGKVMGDGFAVQPANGKIFSSFDGVVTSIFPTKHAITIKASNGVEVLLHMGIDTVALQGEGFEILVSENQEVTPKTQLASIDLGVLKKQEKDNTIIIVFPENFNDEINVKTGYALQNEKVAQFKFNISE